MNKPREFECFYCLKSVRFNYQKHCHKRIHSGKPTDVPTEFQPGYWLNRFMVLFEDLFPMNTLVLRHKGMQYIKAWEDFDKELRQSVSP